MTATAQEPDAREEPFLDYFMTLEPPKGCRAEIIEGLITVTAAPDGDHEHVFSRLVRQILRRSSTEMDVSGNKGLRLPQDKPGPENHIFPDATFTPHDRRLFRGAPAWMSPEGVSLVAEVTGSKPERDRVAKRHCYARAGIPLYLLVDRDESTVTLFAEPAREDYAEMHSVPFGKPLPLPAPFGFDLDTTDFL